jgi:putative copper export protein
MGIGSDGRPAGILQRSGLFLARFCTSAWIGAAALYVVVSVTEVTRAGFDSATKDILVGVRFPPYYVCGVLLVSLAWFGAWLAGNRVDFPKSRRISSLILLALVLALIAIDYRWVYQPLVGMINPPGQAKPAIFTLYHEASKWINLAGMLLCLMAGILVNWPAAAPESARSTR